MRKYDTPRRSKVPCVCGPRFDYNKFFGCPRCGTQVGGYIITGADNNNWTTHADKFCRECGQEIRWYGVDFFENHKDKWTDIVAISAGGRTYSYTAALKKDKTVVVAYPNGLHRFDVSDWSDIVAIAAGDSHLVGLKSNGQVVIATLDSVGSRIVDGWEGITAISAGYGFTLGLTEDGKVEGIGNEWQGQIDVDEWTGIMRKSEWSLIFDEEYMFQIQK